MRNPFVLIALPLLTSCSGLPQLPTPSETIKSKTYQTKQGYTLTLDRENIYCEKDSEPTSDIRARCYVSGYATSPSGMVLDFSYPLGTSCPVTKDGLVLISITSPFKVGSIIDLNTIDNYINILTYNE